MVPVSAVDLRYGGARVAVRQHRPKDVESPWAVGPISDRLEPPTVPVPSDKPDLSSHVVAAPRPRGAVTPRTEEPPASAGDFAWVGAHGGAGVTSLASATGLGLALSQHWPAQELRWPARVVLVCRSNAAGYTAAARMIQEWASGSVPGIELLALVVVADAPARPTRALKTRLHELSGTVPLVLTVPWIAAWRDTPCSADPAATRVAAAVVALITTKENP